MSIEALVARYGLGAVFLGSAFEGETAVVAGGVLARQEYFSLPGAMAAAVTGSLLADQLFFLIGRRFREHRWVQGIRRKPAFARALSLLERYPTGFIFAFRFVYGFRTVSPFAIGSSKVSAHRFLLVNALAALVWGVTFTAIGYLFGDVLVRLRPSHRTVLIGIAVVVAVVALFHIVRRWRERRK